MSIYQNVDKSAVDIGGLYCIIVSKFAKIAAGDVIQANITYLNK